MELVCGVVGAAENRGVVVIEAEARLISSQASLVHPKISLWMRRCCLALLPVGKQDFLVVMAEEEEEEVVVLDPSMAVRSLFCVLRSHFVRRQIFLTCAWVRRVGVLAILYVWKRGLYMRGEVQGQCT